MTLYSHEVSCLKHFEVRWPQTLECVDISVVLQLIFPHQTGEYLAYKMCDYTWQLSDKKSSVIWKLRILYWNKDGLTRQINKSFVHVWVISGYLLLIAENKRKLISSWHDYKHIKNEAFYFSVIFVQKDTK